MEKYLDKNKIVKINKSYDYLINMTFKQLTKINLEKIETKLKDLKHEYKQINYKTNKELWLSDLDELKKMI